MASDFTYWQGRGRLAFIVFAVLIGASPLARAQVLRIVTYNIEADVNGNTAPNTGLFTVLEAVGEQNLNGVQQPIDILGLEETTSETATVAPIVKALNSYYGAGASYMMSNVQGKQNGGNTTGNGPNSLIYNANTVQLVATTGLAGTPNASGVNRQVMRYQFQAIGGTAAKYFYVYVSHMKSSAGGTTTTDLNDRIAEAKLIIADAKSLPAGTSTIYTGDFNMDGSTEVAYQTLTASGTGQGIDPLNVSQDDTITWGSTTHDILTEASTALKYRDDIQFLSPDIYNGTASAALRYVPNSFRAFGNNLSTTYGKSVNTSANTALNNLQGPITASQALVALTTASDHLPVVADYVVATPYNTWQLGHFTSAELMNPAVSGDLADPDGDGIANLMEYALNLDPRQAQVTGLPTVGQVTVSGSQYLTLTYTQRTDTTGITYLPQVSGDLATWNGGPGNTVAVSNTTSPDGLTQTVVVRDAASLTGTNRRFMRLLVSRP